MGQTSRAFRRTAIAVSAAIALSAAPADSAAPSVTLDVSVLHTCGLSAECEIPLEIFVCTATFNQGVATDIPRTTAVECYAKNVNGAAPGMALTTTPGPRATSGGYGNGIFGFEICAQAEATYFRNGTTSVGTVRVLSTCRSHRDWTQIL